MGFIKSTCLWSRLRTRPYLLPCRTKSVTVDQTLSLDPHTSPRLALTQEYNTSTLSNVSQVAAPVKPVPPPPSQPRPDPALTAQRVVYPPKEACQKCVCSRYLGTCV